MAQDERGRTFTTEKEAMLRLRGIDDPPVRDFLLRLWVVADMETMSALVDHRKKAVEDAKKRQKGRAMTFG